ncbi:transposase [Puniceicoccus vermicola]|uniref:Transposase n=1 Tax=Puniceicoccus vermicola TaxID=388746 RepID=A0A7X1E5T4_9BACT|nr:transposase [Puniceicoccus vermicola]MBC2603486.1 transposase [Puniceicoccus vermicola]
MNEIAETLSALEPQSEAAEAQRRKHFAILESYLDRAEGFAPLRQAEVAEELQILLEKYQRDGLAFAGWVIMPNHLHLLTDPFSCANADHFFKRWNHFKQKTAIALNQKLTRQGRFWQKNGYDRWIRGPSEYQRWVEYFRMNPVKAGLVPEGREYPFQRIPKEIPQ